MHFNFNKITTALRTTLQWHRTRDIRIKWNITTVKDYIKHRFIKFYDSLQSTTSPLFSIIQPPTWTTWHISHIINITNTDTEHLHSFHWCRPHNDSALCTYQDTLNSVNYIFLHFCIRQFNSEEDAFVFLIRSC